MRNQFSIVVVCKNEAAVIKALLQSVQGITDDVVIYDNGSTDGTQDIVRQYSHVTLHQGAWEGFGKTKQKAVRLAKHDWILSLDADEALDAILQQALATLQLDDAATVYNLKFKNYLGAKHLKWGEWGFDAHIRLFNRKMVGWNDAVVHETLVMPAGVKVVTLRGYVKHLTMKDMEEYSYKVVQYARLNAAGYAARGKKASWVKRFVSPSFAFIKYYFFMLGFLDGWEGWVCARMTAHYTFLKYARLYELQSLPPET